MDVAGLVNQVLPAIQQLAGLPPKPKALVVIAFYIAADAVLKAFVLHRDSFSWKQLPNFLGKYGGGSFLGLLVLALGGQLVPAVDALFWVALAPFSAKELVDLTGDVSAMMGQNVPSAPAGSVPASGIKDVPA